MNNMTNIKEIYTKYIVQNNHADPKFDGNDTMKIIKYLENYHRSPEYKNKRIFDNYMKLLENFDAETVFNYFDQIYQLKFTQLLFFSKNLILSDYLNTNDNLLKNIVRKNRTDYIIEILKNSSFIIVVKLLKEFKIFHKIKNCQEIENKKFFLDNALLNSDDRIFKFLIKIIDEENLPICLNNIFSCPDKYILKRIKILNNYINLKNHFDKLMEQEYFTLNVFSKIIKIYYNKNLIDNISHFNIKFDLSENYDKLKEICNKKLFDKIRIYLKDKILNKHWYGMNSTKEILKIVIELIEENLMTKKEIYTFIKIIDFDKVIKFDNMDICVYFIKLLQKKFKYFNYEIYKYFTGSVNAFFVFFGNYFSVSIIICSSRRKNLLRINRVKSFLRIYIKKYINKNKKCFAQNCKKLIKDIKFFEPDDTKTILSNGSYQYQLIKQSFLNIKNPIEYLPEYNLQKCFISVLEKGVKIKRVPSIINSKINKTVRGELLEFEDKEIYQINDINLEEMTFVERIKYLRNMHPLKLPEIYFSNNKKSLIEKLEEENKIKKIYFNDFEDDILWYPKGYIFYSGYINDLIKNKDDFQDIEILILKGNKQYKIKI